jgi:transcriptional regulator with XRE-family HTH domain
MRNRLTALKSAAETARQTDAYRAEGASIVFTEALVARMEACGMTRSVLAEKIGTSPAYVTKILRGDTNFTLDTMSKIASALDCELSISLAAKPKTKRQATVNYHATKHVPNPVLNDEI